MAKPIPESGHSDEVGGAVGGGVELADDDLGTTAGLADRALLADQRQSKFYFHFLALGSIGCRFGGPAELNFFKHSELYRTHK